MVWNFRDSCSEFYGYYGKEVCIILYSNFMYLNYKEHSLPFKSFKACKLLFYQM